MSSLSRPATLRPVAAAFVVFGMYGGAFAVAAVDIEHSFSLSDAGLGFLLALGIIAATAVAAVGGAIIDRWGAGPTLRRSLAGWGVLLVAEAVAGRIGLFALVFTLAVAIGGLLDVVMNVTAADALAREPGKLVRFHGLWNGGCVLGAIVAGVVLRVGWSWRVAWIAIAFAAVATAVATGRSRLPEPPKVDHPSMLRALLGLRHEGLLMLGLVFGASAMVEGGIATWGILYLRGHLGLGVLAGVTAYVVGQCLATATRVGSSPIVARLGTRGSVALGAGLAAGGITLEALCNVAGIAALGLVAAAMGISVVWPLLIADVNNEARHPALAIGGVTASGYLGMVAGPPIVGSLSAVFGLRVGLLVLAGVALFVAITPAHVRTNTSTNLELA